MGRPRTSICFRQCFFRALAPQLSSTVWTLGERAHKYGLLRIDSLREPLRVFWQTLHIIFEVFSLRYTLSLK